MQATALEKHSQLDPKTKNLPSPIRNKPKLIQAVFLKSKISMKLGSIFLYGMPN